MIQGATKNADYWVTFNNCQVLVLLTFGESTCARPPARVSDRQHTRVRPPAHACQIASTRVRPPGTCVRLPARVRPPAHTCQSSSTRVSDLQHTRETSSARETSSTRVSDLQRVWDRQHECETSSTRVRPPEQHCWPRRLFFVLMLNLIVTKDAHVR